jgi:hypothetical protein
MNKIKRDVLSGFINSLAPDFATKKKDKAALITKLKVLFLTRLPQFRGKRNELEIKSWIEKGKPTEKRDIKKVVAEVRQEMKREKINNKQRIALLISDDVKAKNILEQIYENIIEKEVNKEIDELKNKNKGKIFATIRSESLLLREPRDEEKFQETLREARSSSKDRIVKQHRKELKRNSVFKETDPVVYYFHNQISSVKDVTDFVDYVCSEEKERFKIHVDFGRIQEIRNESIDGTTYTYEQLSPLEQNLQRIPPMIINDEQTKNRYKNYLKDELINYQNFTSGDTKRMIIAFHSVMLVV